jgi:DNA-directed RNA polymerase subunit RPC12/RpoP
MFAKPACVCPHCAYRFECGTWPPVCPRCGQPPNTTTTLADCLCPHCGRLIPVQDLGEHLAHCAGEA